jgi:hypothetical protein
MTTGVSSVATTLQQAGVATTPAAASSTSAAPATTAGTQQATQGAQQAQPQPEVFNAPMLDLPDDPSTRDVMDGLVRAMADPATNASSAQALLDLHKQLMAAEQAMYEAMSTVNQDVAP